MLWPQGRKSMTMPSATAGGSHCLCRTWEAEPSVVELIYTNLMREDIAKIYWDVYQLQRLLGKMPCDTVTEECLHQEMLNSIKECLWHKQDPAPPEESKCPASTPGMNPQADYSTQDCTNYDWLKDMTRGPCEEALAVARDAHWQVLAATVLLEDKID